LEKQDQGAGAQDNCFETRRLFLVLLNTARRLSRWRKMTFCKSGAVENVGGIFDSPDRIFFRY
jgi:hypothetical protein